jgi:hypothetical protein
MVQSPAFQLWLRIETGRIAVLESTITIPDREVRIETRVGGGWVETPTGQLTR